LWDGAPWIPYVLERATNLALPLPFTAVLTNLTMQASTNSYTESDTNALSAPALYYRLRLSE
jgi:hypothetical protein